MSICHTGVSPAAGLSSRTLEWDGLEPMEQKSASRSPFGSSVVLPPKKENPPGRSRKVRLAVMAFSSSWRIDAVEKGQGVTPRVVQSVPGGSVRKLPLSMSEMEYTDGSLVVANTAGPCCPENQSVGSLPPRRVKSPPSPRR